MPRAKNHKTTQQSAQSTLKGLNLSRLNDTVAQQMKLSMTQQATHASRQEWIQRGVLNQTKGLVVQELTQNSNNYKELHRAMLTLSRGNPALANRMLNKLIDRLIQDQANPALIKQLEKINALTRQQKAHPNTQPALAPTNPNVELGLQFAIQNGYLTPIAIQEITEEALEETEYENELQEEQTHEHTLQHENLTESSLENNNTPRPEPKLSAVEIYHEGKHQAAFENFSETAEVGKFLKMTAASGALAEAESLAELPTKSHSA